MARIQKRTITFGSAQPPSSKWWWSGRHAEDPLAAQLEGGHLEDHRQRLDARTGRRLRPGADLLLGEDRDACRSPPPSASEPTSPMKTSAGWELYHRKPRHAPTRAPQNTVTSPTPGDVGDLQVVGDHRVAGDVGEERVGGRGDSGGADRQAVEAVGEVDRVRRADQHEARRTGCRGSPRLTTSCLKNGKVSVGVEGPSRQHPEQRRPARVAARDLKAASWRAP